MWVEFECTECEQQNRFDLANFEPAGERDVDGRIPYEADCGDCGVPYRVFVNPDHAEQVQIGDDAELALLTYRFADERTAQTAWKAELQRSRKRAKRKRNIKGRTLEEALLAFDDSSGPPRRFAAMQREGDRLIMLFGVQLETVKRGLRTHTPGT